MTVFDAERFRQAFLAHQTPPDPLDIVSPENVTGLSADWIEDKRRGLRVAAILVPLVVQPNGSVEVLLTERAAHLKHHPGQISFPGGASEPDDRGLAETAIRETAEEVGIAVPAIDVIGYLRPQWTISSYAMTPVVALIQGPIAPVVDQQEVADAFLVPAERIFERRFQAVQRRSFEGMEFDAVEINWGEKRIWGATATVIQRVTKIIENNEI